MAAALLTAVIASVAGIGMAIYVGLTAVTIAMLSRHITIGIFSTMICLLSHSMMMFYFLGKGKAVREAAAEGGLSKEFERRIAVARNLWATRKATLCSQPPSASCLRMAPALRASTKNVA